MCKSETIFMKVRKKCFDGGKKEQNKLDLKDNIVNC